MNRLRQLWRYSCKTYDLGVRLRQTREDRLQPRIPLAPVVTSLFLGALLRVRSFLKLGKKTRKRNWQRLVRYPEPLNHEAFNYVSEFIRLDDLRENLYVVARCAKANKALERWKLGGLLALALDANELFARRSHCCEACCSRKIKVIGADGQTVEVTEYYHRAVFAHLVGADLLLDLEPIRPGEEECAAALRLLGRLRRRLGPRFFDVVTADAWYTKTPFLQAVRKLGWEAVVVLKQADYHASQEAQALRPRQAQENFQHQGRQVQLREVRDLTLTQKAQPKVRVVSAEESWEERRRQGQTWTRQRKESHWQWVATEGLDHLPVKTIWLIGHGRWAIENHGFNQLTQYYHLTHCYHHHPLAIEAWLLILLLAVDITTLFFRHWVVPRVEADYTRSDLVEEFCEDLVQEADWERCLDTS